MDIKTREEKKHLKEPIERQRPVQGLYSIDKEVMQKCCQGPFKVVGSDVVSILPAKVGVRYFIHSVTVMATQVAATATSNTYVTLYQDGSAVNVGNVIISTGLVQTTIESIILDVLTDVNTSVQKTTTADSAWITISYCEVPV